ncbi:uncharacterized protein Tco025E_09280 [Trypanosoma conorhini]|uniref:Uncharacterized protein n=1 Tax=Trypanosoma conorhini TaxID=83891 RepID=A0A3R7R973_9TRYP|nr:uncharacterized protein Tco025E_09280 [Trypanosoma conorhini]RNE98180.1 hypothetical protein Tco025E_09280 [Trypanosoma conorhini]
MGGANRGQAKRHELPGREESEGGVCLGSARGRPLGGQAGRWRMAWEHMCFLGAGFHGGSSAVADVWCAWTRLKVPCGRSTACSLCIALCAPLNKRGRAKLRPASWRNLSEQEEWSVVRRSSPRRAVRSSGTEQWTRWRQRWKQRCLLWLARRLKDANFPCSSGKVCCQRILELGCIGCGAEENEGAEATAATWDTAEACCK